MLSVIEVCKIIEVENQTHKDGNHIMHHLSLNSGWWEYENRKYRLLREIGIVKDKSEGLYLNSCPCRGIALACWSGRD